MRTAARILLLATCGALGACGATHPPGEQDQPGAATGSTDDIGAVSLELQIGSNIHIDAVSYTITNGPFNKGGTLDVSHATAASGVIDGLPAGSGYLIALTASDADHRLTGCAGSSSFAVTAHATTPVPVAVSCHEVRAAPPAPVPFPPLAAAAIAFLLLAVGARALRAPPPPGAKTCANLSPSP